MNGRSVGGSARRVSIDYHPPPSVGGRGRFRSVGRLKGRSEMCRSVALPPLVCIAPHNTFLNQTKYFINYLLGRQERRLGRDRKPISSLS